MNSPETEPTPGESSRFPELAARFFDLIESMRSAGILIQEMATAISFPPKQILDQLEKKGFISDRMISEKEISFKILNEAAARHLSFFHDFRTIKDRIPRFLIIGIRCCPN